MNNKPPSTAASSSTSSSSALPPQPPIIKEYSLEPYADHLPAQLHTPSAPSASSPSYTSSSLSATSTTPHAALTPSSNKRTRESCTMNDPIEAARYTPPREMFKPTDPPSVSMEQEISSSLASPLSEVVDASMLDEDMFDADDATAPTASNGDSELDDLGQQLSLHSPEKPGSAGTSTEVSSGSKEEPSSIIASAESIITAASSLPTPDQQAKIIMDLGRKPLEEGDPWYLIDSRWMVAFRRYCSRHAQGQEADPPGPIDNSNLFDLSGHLKRDLGGNVTTVPQKGWDLLVSWYGSSTAPVRRVVVNTGSELRPHLMIDYYPPTLLLYWVIDSPPDLDSSSIEPEQIEVSRTTKFGDLKASLLSRANITGEVRSRLWAFPPHLIIPAEGNTIRANNVVSVGAICLENVADEATVGEITELTRQPNIANVAMEVANESGFLVQNVPAPGLPMSSTNTSTASSPMFLGQGSRFGVGLGGSGSSSMGSKAEGICGLQNLGNTCFMNSALQCLSNTPDLTAYFLANAWQDELNLDNPLGMDGEVAKAYANLIGKLWNGTARSFAPREFKSTIGRFAPTFTGYQQHDSQELLAFLLDGLHEDLNRIKKKPYTEIPDSNGRPDEEVAKICWDLHKARNDSIIVDLFQGQYKSTLVCPVCNKVSVTFDPFMYLSLPLPISKKWVGSVTFVPYDPSRKLVDIRLIMPKGSSMKQLKERVATLTGCSDASRLFAAEIYNNKFYKIHENHEPVDTLQETDVTFIYELPVAANIANNNNNSSSDSDEYTIVPVFHILSDPSTSRYTRFAHRGHPMMVAFTKEEAQNPEAVYAEILRHSQRYTTVDLDKLAHKSHATSVEMQGQDEDAITEVPAVSTAGVDGDEPMESESRPATPSDKPAAAAGTPEDDELAAPPRRLCTISAYTPTVSRYSPRHPYTSGPHAAPQPNSHDLHEIFERAGPKSPLVVGSRGGRLTDGIANHLGSSNDSVNYNSSSTDHDIAMSSVQTLTGGDDSPSPAPTLSPKSSDEIELSEEDDPATLGSMASIDFAGSSSTSTGIIPMPPPAPTDTVASALKSAVKSTRPSRPAVLPGELVFVHWEEDVGNVIFHKQQRSSYIGRSSYRLSTSINSDDSDQDEKAENRALWDARDEKIIDPVLQEELVQATSAAGKKKKDITLEDCLAEYTKEEQLGEDDLWYCPNCKEHRQATKKLDIWKLPDLLVVHLKRFSHTRAWRDKIDALVDFPIVGLDLRGKALKEDDENENIYDLYGVSNHMGGLGGGHYTAYAKNVKQDEWFNFDDSHVTPVSKLESIKSSNAYLLFYRRRGAPVREYEHRPAKEMMDTTTVGRMLGSGSSFGASSSASGLRPRLLSVAQDDESNPFASMGLGMAYPPSTNLGVRSRGLGRRADEDDDNSADYSEVHSWTRVTGKSSTLPRLLSNNAADVDDDGPADEIDEDDDDPLPAYEDVVSVMPGIDAGVPSSSSSDFQQDHSPTMSTAASDGSNPGTGFVSRDSSPSPAGSPTSFPATPTSPGVAGAAASTSRHGLSSSLARPLDQELGFLGGRRIDDDDDEEAAADADIESSTAADDDDTDSAPGSLLLGARRPLVGATEAGLLRSAVTASSSITMTTTTISTSSTSVITATTDADSESGTTQELNDE